MEHTENTFVVLKKHEEQIQSSLHGNVIGLQQLCQNKSDKTHYFTYEVLDQNGSVIGGRLIYELKEPNKSLELWEKFINDDLSPIDYTMTKQELVQTRKLKM